ncbi:MAG: DUF4364 family protein [Lachnospiraceae bacterium]|nr:DUF4364 family protein [Lachnospiraceae bacterium]
MAELDTMYRIMILYMLDKVEYPLTNTQITNFILEKDYTNYFTVQQTLSDLLSSDLIIAEPTHSNTRYRITDEGVQTLRFFEDKISSEIKEDILSYLQEHNFELIQETDIYADFFKAVGNGYQVRCRVKEKEMPVIDLTLAVQTRQQAEAVCANWKKESAEVYALLMDSLMK